MTCCQDFYKNAAALRILHRYLLFYKGQPPMKQIREVNTGIGAGAAHEKRHSGHVFRPGVGARPRLD